MKPAFALSLSDNGITLLHQSDGDWFGIGNVSLDDPDFSEHLNELRVQAFALANDLSCTLVLPSDHVRYLTIEADAQTQGDLTRTIESELAQATACAITDLIYDQQQDGTKIHVAAVAGETVAEARSFASQYGFVPVGFAAAAQYETWPGTVAFEFSEPSSVQLTQPDQTQTDTVVPSPLGSPEVVEVPIAEQTQAPEVEHPAPLAAHPIAEPAKPDVFRSAHQANKGEEQAADTPDRWSLSRVVIAAVAGVAALTVGVWIWSTSKDPVAPVAALPPVETPVPAPVAETPAPETSETAQIAPIQDDIPDPEALADDSLLAEVAPPAPDEPQDSPELSATDAAILEALNVAPSPVEQVARDPEHQEVVQEVTGLTTAAPESPPPPPSERLDEIYLSTVDRVGLSQDPVALPPAQSFETDDPVSQIGLPSVAGTRFELDDRGLVTPTPEGTLTPDGILVFLGRPSSVPPQVPVRFETDPTIDETNVRLAGLRPRDRPARLVESFERGQLGGRSRNELAVIRPKSRPASVQERAQIDETPTALAVVRVPRPRARPSTVAVLAARKSSTGTASLGSTAAVKKTVDDDGGFEPKTVAPKIPTTASVARQATMDNALNLRRLNLIGVYGTPANRRALVRLPSGRYKKLKVGDRIDGGNVVAIGDSELLYQKNGRNHSLKMPRS